MTRPARKAQELRLDKLLELCLPLKVVDSDEDLRIVGELHDAICSMAYQGSEAWSDDGFILPHKRQAIAYANFIVKAVNTYPRLLDALERVADIDCFQPWGVTCDKIDDSGEQPCESCEARALLRECRGERQHRG